MRYISQRKEQVADLSKSKESLRRPLIDGFDKEFARVYSLWTSLVQACGSQLFSKPPEKPEGPSLPSVGESIIRSARVVEQTCGGITANLWDDPLEWTLEETLSSPQRLVEYLDEVEATRKRAFDSFQSDSDLLKQISTPSGELQTLGNLLLNTLARAAQFQGQAALVATTLFVRNPSRFII